MDIKVTLMHQASNVDNILDNLPYEVEGECPEAEIPVPRHSTRAFGYNYLRQLGTAADTGVIDALGKEGEENGDKHNVPDDRSAIPCQLQARTRQTYTRCRQRSVRIDQMPLP